MQEKSSDSSTAEYENKQLDITFTNPQSEKEEKYKFLDEEKESLLLKEFFINNQYQIRIQELFQNENEGQYYINKEKIKEKYLKNCFDLDKNNQDLIINRQDVKEMDELYKETSLKHPRKFIDGEIRKYSFCSWIGCFTCNKCRLLEKNEFYPLGFGISSYFKSLKLFIFFFLVIACVNLYAVNYYLKYKSVIEDNSFFFKTTLGNTKITTYNGVLYQFKRNNYPKLSLKCQQNKTIGKFLYVIELNSLEDAGDLIFQNETDIYFGGKNFEKKDQEYLNYFNEKIIACNYTNECSLTIDSGLNKFYFIPKERYIYLYYECYDKSLLPENDEPNTLKSINELVSIFTLLSLILLYYYYRFATDIDNKEYHKDKININNYTLVLKGLKRKSKDFFQELNDLMIHLNTVISSSNNPYEQDLTFFRNGEYGNYSEFVRNKNNIFDISLSTVNEKKISIINSIKSLKEEIKDIKEGQDTMAKKVVNQIYNAVTSVTSLYSQIINRNKEEEEDNPNDEALLNINDDENITEKNKKKINKNKEKIQKQIKKVTKNAISGLHMDSDKSTYVDIYITFRNPALSNFIYQNYKRNFFQRFLLFICCRVRIIKLFYYKRQWLNFEIANNAPTNIIWENAYISSKKIFCRRVFSYTIGFFTIIISSIIFYFLYVYLETIDNKMKTYYITGIIQVISIISSTILEKLTKCEKNSNLTRNMTSDIEKYFFLNFAVSTISVNIPAFFIYKKFHSSYPIIMTSILQSMLLSAVTAHLSTLAKYLFNLLKRYLDSNCQNGKKTKLKKKMEYEELYIGPDFPIASRLSTIFVNLGLCLLYGTSCPLIYLFFALNLITTFFVDKFLIIHYYKKPPYYDNYFTLLTKKILFFSIILNIYGSVYYISNPYLFNYYQNNSIDFGYSEFDKYLILNPFTSIHRFIGLFDAVSINYYNFNNLGYNYVVLMFGFFVSLILIKMCSRKDKNKKDTLQNAPNIDIGLIYTLDELNKYYEVKKLELFKFILHFGKNESKDFQKYSKLADNYKNSIDYIRQNINYKNSLNYIRNEEHNIQQNNIMNQNIINTNNTDPNVFIVRNKEERQNDRLLIGDASYNLAFIPNYELYAYFDLLYYV